MVTENTAKRSVLLIVTGSIAATKVPELIRLLKDKAMDVTAVLTEAGGYFISPLTLASLTGKRVYSELFSIDEETEMGHIQLSRKSDLIVVAPATANTIAKMAQGISDDLASTILLATDKPVLVVPAMNVRMWEHPATQRNVQTLRKDGVVFVGPSKGALACGEEGHGRMVEPSEIVDEIQRFYDFKKLGRPLQGKKALVTSGPTVEAIDPVRYIANRSSGKQGHAIAAALKALGADVTLVSGPTALPDPVGVKMVKVESAREMLDACYKALPVDMAVCAAAVSDWRSSNLSEQKIKKPAKKSMKPEDMLTFTFMENPDILECLGKHGDKRPQLVVGFAAETENVVKNAKAKMQRKGCDWILANDVSGGSVFGSEDTEIHYITVDGEEHWPLMSKRDVAFTLASRMSDYFSIDPKLRKNNVTKLLL
ncbi:MAG: bifunctional phosphopantothenoylcysteine decarboxylase/phosphopantothenate--cysteine ligase CoaBC [Proteobacteria bacterium]|nr:bifunctional phosphopantothenoylcysteine decarboxylase/phosphopantothenate--cysteine ligase CoaBC [Pseudomonadota bacterium]